jgi:hypothetical protein
VKPVVAAVAAQVAAALHIDRGIRVTVVDLDVTVRESTLAWRGEIGSGRAPAVG